jgi:membrane protease YdiL (CAAX protease family)
MTRNMRKRADIKVRKLGADEFFILILISEAAMLLGALISNLIGSFFGYVLGSTPENSVDALVSGGELVLTSLMACVFAPIFEELMFRKILFDRMSVYGDRLAILVTSVAFGLFHANLYQLFYTACFGFVLGYAYARTRRIKYPIMLHMIANFLGTIPALLLSDYVLNVPEIDPSATVTPEMAEEVLVWLGATLTLLFTNYGLAIAGIITVIVLLILGKVHIPKTREVKLPLYTIPRVTIFNLGAIIFGVIILALIVLPYAVALMPAG